MAEKKFKLPLLIEDIKNCIPHRYPFLLIDKVTELIPGEKVVAIRNISASDPILQGHFPGNPIYPGVLQVEGLAQAAAVLGILSQDGPVSACLLTEVSSARFRRQVIPGDCLTYTVTVKKKRLPFYWFEANAMVGDEVAAEVLFSAKLG